MSILRTHGHEPLEFMAALICRFERNKDLQLKFTKEEILTDHEYAKAHVIGDRRLHGGFSENGSYQPPRTKVRSIAVANWLAALRDRGGELLKADSSLLSGPRVPNVAQQRLLLRNGLGRFFWNGLTIIGKIEARGKMLATAPFPELQNFIEEDISEMAIGHLNRGMLIAHGIDEGGEPEKGIGGHDQMWFIARDLAFGRNAYPDVDPPAGSIARNEENHRYMPGIAPPVEAYLRFLMNLLVIEFRAEIGFAATQDVLRTEGLFEGRREDALLAAEIVERIRTDERIHVESLRLYLGEMRSVSFKSERGDTIPGTEIIDPFWEGLIAWSTGDQPQNVARQSYEGVKSELLKLDDGKRILDEFDALHDVNFQLAAG